MAPRPSVSEKGVNQLCRGMQKRESKRAVRGVAFAAMLSFAVSSATQAQVFGLDLGFGSKNKKKPDPAEIQKEVSPDLAAALSDLRPPANYSSDPAAGAAARLTYYASVLAAATERLDQLEATSRVDGLPADTQSSVEVARNGVTAALDVVRAERAQLEKVQKQVSKDLDGLKSRRLLNANKGVTVQSATDLLHGLRTQIRRTRVQERQLIAHLDNAELWIARRPPPPPSETTTVEAGDVEAERVEVAAPLKPERVVEPATKLEESPIPEEPKVPDEQIFFDRPHVNFSNELRRFLSRPPGGQAARVRVVGVAPLRVNERDIELGRKASEQFAGAVVRSLVRLGIDASRINATTSTSADAFGPEVHLYWEAAP